ncbi:hypothetical protein M5K25_022494 [Dendrobium thyrsiflorum]|uniref:Uncharacterized protein n=1 Tax=Dendrobium thyrsiflorum TaxID=117978 RepID=A0ABD0U6T3_DENTH
MAMTLRSSQAALQVRRILRYSTRRRKKGLTFFFFFFFFFLLFPLLRLLESKSLAFLRFLSGSELQNIPRFGLKKQIGRLEAALQRNAAARASQILLPLLAPLHPGQQRNAPICFAGFGGGAVLPHIAGVRKPAVVGAKPKLGDFSGMRLTKEIAAGAPGLSWLEEMIVLCVFLCEGKIEKKRPKLAERSEKVAGLWLSHMGDSNCSTQLIDGDGVYNVYGMENFMKIVKLGECGL